ncbi:MAG: BON domain-containing protein [Vicinamibacterales bacterium]
MGSSLAWQTDTQLRDSVERQLQWDPEIESANIAVIASDGVITLTGVVRSYPAKLGAEQSVRRVRGVRGVANEIRVAPPSQRTDTEIAKAAVHALQARADMPTSVAVTARNGVLTLEGTVRWMFQRTAAGAAVMHLDGVTGVSNQIDVTPSVAVGQVKTDIDAALHRCADVDARHITVTVDGSVVTLSGEVSSCYEKPEAERAASGAPGITRVENNIIVGLPREIRSTLP